MAANFGERTIILDILIELEHYYLYGPLLPPITP